MEYKKFHLTVRDWIVCCGEYIIIISMISYLFFDSFLSLILLLPFFIIFEKRYKSKAYERRKEELKKGFLNSLQSISTSLTAGLSPENALVEAVWDMNKMYGDKSIIVVELQNMNRVIASGIRMEDAFFDFAKRSDIEAIYDFAIVFAVAKKSGGSLSETISRCIEVINMANETAEEMKILIRSKQYEQRIMSVVPLGMIIYLRFSSGSFLDVLYHNILGIGIMSICLVMYTLSIYLGERICKVEL